MAREGSHVRAVLSSIVFIVVVLSSAAAGWALIEHSGTDRPTDVRSQITVAGTDGNSTAVEVAPFDGNIPVLVYGPIDEEEGHGVTDPATFADQLAALDAAGFETVTVDDVEALVTGGHPILPERPILITVDATHKSIWTTIDPLLADHGFDAVAFVDPDLVVDHATSARLTVEELDALADEDRWTIGLGIHDVFEADDDGTPDGLRSLLDAEIDDRLAAFDALIGERPDSFAYSASGPHATEAAFQAGRAAEQFASVSFTETRTEMASPSWPAWGLPRINPEGLTGAGLVRRIAGITPRAPEGLDAPPDPEAPPVTVSLSWDDGRSSTYRSLIIQERYDFEATYFINSDQIGTSGYYLSRGQLDEVEAAGNEIGGHTEGHVNLTKVSRARARSAICDDRDTLVDWYGPSAGRSFAYPFGANPGLEEQVEECGYDSARITSGIQGPNRCADCPLVQSIPPFDSFAIATSGSIQSDWTLAQLQTLVLQAEESGGGWVNYVLHAISASPDDDYGITPETYDALLAWLAERPNVTVRTIGDVIADS